MINLNYFIWLQTALGAGANVSSISEAFSSPEEVYRASEKERRLSGVFSSKQLEKLGITDIEKSYEIIELCASMGIDIITPDSTLYPARLREIAAFPLVLYAKGDISCINSGIPLAIVGTREPAERSRRAAQALAYALSSAGFVTVSGGALGIDTAAHTGAMLAGGKTVAVLGSGIGARYLASNESLRNSVSEHGALVSELPPLKEPYAGSFPIRNRIIAGMTCGTVVAEAGIKSGSLITSKYAQQFDRDVFAVPGLSVCAANRGSEELLRDGAKPVVCAFDVLSEYVNVYPEKIIIDERVDLLKASADFELSGLPELPEPSKEEKHELKKRKLADDVPEAVRKVYGVFGNEPLSIDYIAEVLEMSPGSILGAVTSLELSGLIELLPNTKYILKREG